VYPFMKEKYKGKAPLTYFEHTVKEAEDFKNIKLDEIINQTL